MSESPVLTFFLAVILGCTAYDVLFKLPNRLFRHLNIRKHGWPPDHCDADGDFKPDNNNDV